MNNLKINDKYTPLFINKGRYFICTGGRGSSKSFTVSVFLLNLTYEKGHKILFTRYTMISANTSIIPEFIEKIDLMGVNDHFRITKDEIINLQTGSSIIFKGIRTSSGNQTAALKSLSGVTTFVVDEAEELVEEDMFDKIDLSIRSEVNQNRVILILNPTTKEHWIYKRFFEMKGIKGGYNGVDEDVTYIHTTYKDNKDNLSESFLKRIYEIKKTSPTKYEHQILGGWLSKASGVVFSNWRVGAYIETERTVYAQDWGFSDAVTTLVKISIDKEKKIIYVKELYGYANKSTSDIAKLNKMHCGLDLIICDSSEPRLIKELKDAGLNIKPTIKKIGSILSGLALMNDYEIVVDRMSVGIMRDLNNYVWKEKGTVPIDTYNDYIDAIRYGVQYLLQGINTGKYVIR